MQQRHQLQASRSNAEVSNAFLPGPLVAAAQSLSTVQIGIDLSVLSNNAEIILSMLDATSGTEVDLAQEAA